MEAELVSWVRMASRVHSLGAWAPVPCVDLCPRKDGVGILQPQLRVGAHLEAGPLQRS